MARVNSDKTKFLSIAMFLLIGLMKTRIYSKLLNFNFFDIDFAALMQFRHPMKIFIFVINRFLNT
jgi:hypothetical protein